MKTLGIILLSCLLQSPALAQNLKDAYDAYGAKDFAEAEKGFSSEVEAAPEDPLLLHNLGVAQYRLGKFKEAKSQFLKAAGSSQGSQKSRSLLNLGNSEAKLGDLKSAEKSYQEALSFDLDNKAANENLVWVRKEIEKQKNQEKKQDNKEQKEGDKKDQKKSDDSKNGQQDNKEKQGQKNSEKQEEKDQDSQQKEGEKNKEEQTSESKQAEEQKKKAEDQDKSAEKQGQKDKDKQQSAEKKELQPKPLGEKKAEEKPGKKPEDQPSEASTPQEGKPEAPLSQALLEKQDAERILRSVEDQISKYMFRPTKDQLKGRSKNGKDW